MVAMCPNKSHPDWKAIENEFGEEFAYKAYIMNGENIPSLDQAKAAASIIDPSYKSRATPASVMENNKKEAASAIRSEIEGHLRELGVGVGVLTPLDEASGAAGVMDPTVQRKNAEGLIEVIRVARGEKGDAALGEEFAHVVIGSIKNNVFYERLMAMFHRDPGVIKAVFERDEAGSYEQYFEKYKGDMERMAVEAAGKLLKKHLFEQKPIAETQKEKNILERLIDVIKRVWGAISSDTLTRRLARLDNEFGSLATRVFDRTIELELNFNSPAMKSVLFSLTEAQRVLNDAFVRESHRRSIITRNTAKDSDPMPFRAKTKEILRHAEHSPEQGISYVLDNFVGEAEARMKEIDDLFNTPGYEPRKIARLSRNMKVFTDAYGPIIDRVSEYLRTPEFAAFKQVNPTLASILENYVSSVIITLNNARLQYKNTAVPLAHTFVMQFTGGLIGQKLRGEEVTSDTVLGWLNNASNDIGWFDRYLRSMSESNSTLFRLLDQPVQRAKHNANIRTQQLVHEMQHMQEELESKGIKTSFMYERNKKGKLTGFFIGEYNTGQFFEDIDELKNRLISESSFANEEEYANARFSIGHPKAAEALAIESKINTFINDNTDLLIIDKEYQQRPSRKYKNPQFEKEMKNAAKRKFYNRMIEIKKEMDELLPDNRQVASYIRYGGVFAPQVRSDFKERIATAESGKQAMKRLVERVRDNWVQRTDDQTGTILTNPDGTERYVLPAYYRDKLEDMDMLSVDAVSSMAQFVHMATTYNEMDNVVDIMEVIRDHLREQGATIRDLNSADPTKVKQYEILMRDKKVKLPVMKKSYLNFMARLDDYFEAQIYGRGMKNPDARIKLWGNVSINRNKLANNLAGMAAANTYAFNGLAAIANVATGTVMARIDAMAGEFFNMKDLAKADALYLTHLHEVVMDIGQRRPKSKMALMIEKFNVLQDYDKSIQHLKMNRKNVLNRLFTGSTAYAASMGGEHYMQTRTFLALATKMKLKDARGRSISLWDAFEVKKNANGIEELVLKNGVRKVDGSEFSADDVFRLSQKNKSINHKLHGIYNNADKNAFQQTFIGSAVMMYRKWMVPAVNRRWQSENYNFNTGVVEEGFYLTTWHFAQGLFRELDGHRFNIAGNWNQLTQPQKKNMIRMIAEVAHLIVLMVLSGLLLGMKGDDDDWWEKLARYQVERLKMEMLAYVPSMGFLESWLRILNSPAAVLDYITKVINFTYSLGTWPLGGHGARIIEQGRYKDHSALYRDFCKVSPYYGPFTKMFDPDESLRYFIGQSNK
jgi:hypothetical protein